MPLLLPPVDRNRGARQEARRWPLPAVQGMATARDWGKTEREATGFHPLAHLGRRWSEEVARRRRAEVAGGGRGGGAAGLGRSYGGCGGGRGGGEILLRPLAWAEMARGELPTATGGGRWRCKRGEGVTRGGRCCGDGGRRGGPIYRPGGARRRGERWPAGELRGRAVMAVGAGAALWSGVEAMAR